jgi:hypothetical protein
MTTRNPQPVADPATDPQPVADPATDPQPVAVADPATDPQPVAVADPQPVAVADPATEKVDTRKIPTIAPYSFAGIIEPPVDYREARVDPVADPATSQPVAVADPATSQPAAPVVPVIPQQRTIPGCGLFPVVAPVLLGDDIVECSDGTHCRHDEAWYDCLGCAHSTEEDAHDRNVEVVTIILDNRVAWATEYATENDDYTSGYDHCVGEDFPNYEDDVKEWVENELDDSDAYPDRPYWLDPAAVIERIGQAVYDKLADDAGREAYYNCEVEYSCCEYFRYTGSGLCVGGFAIGEIEEQVDINGDEVLSVLHDMRLLDGCLDDYSGDAYIGLDRQREKNEKTGRYEYVGPKTYMPYPRSVDYPDFLFYHSPGGRWDYVVSEETMKDIISDIFDAEIEDVDVEDFDLCDYLNESDGYAL